MAQRDPEATRERILRAATAEFAQHGLAGARVNRIAKASGSNKSMIYFYFDSKDLLFDAVIEAAFLHTEEAVPFNAKDLVAYGAALFDHLCEHPDYLRLGAWRRLERSDRLPLEATSIRNKVNERTEVRSGASREEHQFSPADELALVTRVATAWLAAPEALRRAGTNDAKAQRDLVIKALSLLTTSQWSLQSD